MLLSVAGNDPGVTNGGLLVYPIGVELGFLPPRRPRKLSAASSSLLISDWKYWNTYVETLLTVMGVISHIQESLCPVILLTPTASTLWCFRRQAAHAGHRIKVNLVLPQVSSLPVVGAVHGRVICFSSDVVVGRHHLGFCSVFLLR